MADKPPTDVAPLVIPLLIVEYNRSTVLVPSEVVRLIGLPEAVWGVAPIWPLPWVFEETNPHALGQWHVLDVMVFLSGPYAGQVCVRTPAVVLSLSPSLAVINEDVTVTSVFPLSEDRKYITFAWSIGDIVGCRVEHWPHKISLCSRNHPIDYTQVMFYGWNFSKQALKQAKNTWQPIQTYHPRIGPVSDMGLKLL